MSIRLLVPKGGFRNCILITGFHGIGVTGYIAISHLISVLKAKKIGYIETEYSPPLVFMDGKQLVTPFEIYRSNKFVLVKSEFPPYKKDEVNLAKALVDWTLEERFREAILIGGLDDSFKTKDDDSLRIAPTNAYLPKASTFNADFLESGLHVAGPLAVMLAKYEMHNFPAVAILPYAASRPDPRAAAVAIKKICDVYRLNVDVSSLVQHAEEIEKELEERRRTQNNYPGMFV